MGKSNWDRISSLDTVIQHSATHFEQPTPYLTLHRELIVEPGRVKELAEALADPGKFVGVVSNFLENWSHETDRLGLAALADVGRDG